MRFPIPSCKRPCAPSMYRWPRRRLPTTSAMRRMPICCSICRTTVEKESYPKFYFSDNGIVSLFLDRKESVQLENMAAVALTRAYPDDVYYLKSAKTGIDIDFYVPSIGLAVQAAYSIAGDAREREVGSLKKLAQNSQGAARLVIVTYEEEETIIEDGVTIEAVPLYKFLLELESGKYGAAY